VQSRSQVFLASHSRTRATVEPVCFSFISSGNKSSTVENKVGTLTWLIVDYILAAS
jgi:hypothetical protein